MSLLNYAPSMLLRLTCLRVLLTHLSTRLARLIQAPSNVLKISIKGKFKIFLIKEEIND